MNLFLPSFARVLGLLLPRTSMCAASCERRASSRGREVRVNVQAIYFLLPLTV
jgi:hypothetical protein